MNFAEKEIKKTKQKVLIILFCIAGLFVYGVYWAFFSMDRLPIGEKIAEKQSPDGTYTFKAYVTNGGATTSFAVRGELVFNHREYFKTKNVYWNYREDTAKIVWKDNDTVIINGHTLNVPEDTYDFRNE
ncbi:DUF5412 domain-containing protein [Bacillus cereus group sp. MYBK163-2]|uniref:DUF5412 domain-containing protein n=1 Tax=Bacillus cereus group TaxID=86661 RepID=UPI0005CAB30A|nr:MULTISPECIES: DUF5412 domain-containing protein [Bacillus cereus group]KAA0781050.1 hypothetical protein DN404_01195 [Bacillus sp. TE8-1]KIZ28953.1 hypothetical protein SK30_18175 [Bacillus cereus]MBJ8126501.1 DUF5412 domain-containing protein [Bacillus cereus]PEV55336.1 hypothetical protein CN422_25710 [Bacillus cereus]PGB50004.1 hypothetical protein COL95_24530 [Bacillus anthracis]